MWDKLPAMWDNLPAMCDNWPGILGVDSCDSSEEGQERTWVFWHTVIWPGRVLELLDLTTICVSHLFKKKKYSKKCVELLFTGLNEVLLTV